MPLLLLSREVLRRLTFAIGCLGVGAQPIPAQTIVIHAGHLIDGLSAEEQGPSSIIIDGERITAVQPGFVSPSGAAAIDLSQATVLPGLINLHVHLTESQILPNSIENAITYSDLERVLFSTVPAKAALMAGFTSVRDVGSNGLEGIALKRAIAAGWIEGPRMWVSGPLLSPTGGHGDQHSGLDPALEDPQWDMAVADGPEAYVKIVRTLKRDGADLIKIATSGGVGSVGDSPKDTLMTQAEVRAVVDTAHSLGMKVAAHAQNKRAVTLAVINGVDSIEHGAGADQESYQLMRTHGTYLVPTMLPVLKIKEAIALHPDSMSKESIEKALSLIGGKAERTCAAYRAGVKLGFGTDMPVVYGKVALPDFPKGKDVSAKEFKLLVDACLPPMEAIFTATRNAADLIGDNTDIGAIAHGRYADAIAVQNSPLKDITELERPIFVMKGGKVYKGAGP